MQPTSNRPAITWEERVESMLVNASNDDHEGVQLDLRLAITMMGTQTDSLSPSCLKDICDFFLIHKDSKELKHLDSRHLTRQLYQRVNQDDDCKNCYLKFLKRGTEEVKSEGLKSEDGKFQTTRSEIYLKFPSRQIDILALSLASGDELVQRRQALSYFAYKCFSDSKAQRVFDKPDIEGKRAIIKSLKNWGLGPKELKALLFQAFKSLGKNAAEIPAAVEIDKEINDLRECDSLPCFSEVLQSKLSEWRDSQLDQIYEIHQSFFDGKIAPGDVQAFQKSLSSSLALFIKENLIKAPWCGRSIGEEEKYAILALGSLARAEASILSDVELIILSNEEHKKIVRIYDLIDLGAMSFCEGGRIYNEYSHLSEDWMKGLFLDMVPIHSHRCLPISTPEAFAELQERWLYGQEKERASLLNYTCLHETDSSLVLDYEKNLSKQYEDPSKRQKRALEYLKLIKKLSFCQKNIKEGFLQPLTLMIDALYLNEHNPSKGIPNTLEALDAMTSLFSKEDLRLLKKIVAGLYLVRLRYDCEVYASRRQNIPNQFTLMPTELEILDIAEHLVIGPLFDQTRQSVPKKICLLFSPKRLLDFTRQQQVREVLPAYRAFLKYFLKDDDRAARHYLILSEKQVLEPFRRAFVEKFGYRPEPNLDTCYRYTYLEQYENLSKALDGLEAPSGQETTSNGLKLKLSTIQWDGHLVPPPLSRDGQARSVYLDPALFQSIIDFDALAEADESTQHRFWFHPCKGQNSLHVVHRVEAEKGTIYLKELPTHPCMEYAVSNLHYRLFGHGVAPGVLANLTVERPGGTPTEIPIWISQEVCGRPLSSFKQKPKNLKKADWTEMILSHILTVPGDAHGGNLIIGTNGSVISIDNEASFVLLLENQDIRFTSAPLAYKWVDRLHRPTLHKFLDCNPDRLVSAWLEEMIQIEDHWPTLFSANCQKKVFSYIPTPNDKESNPRLVNSALKFVMAPGAVTRLERQIWMLQDYIKNNEQISPFDLCAQIIDITKSLSETLQIGKRIANRYKQCDWQWFSTIPLHERLSKVRNEPKYLSSSSDRQWALMLKEAPTYQQIMQGNYSPRKALKELTNMYHICSAGFEMSLTKDGVIARGSKKASSSKEDQDRFLNLLSYARNKKVIQLPNMDSVKLETLEMLIEPCTTHLDIHGCENVDDTCIDYISRKFGEQIISLNVRNCKKITGRIGSVLQDSIYWNFPNLETLDITDCTNLSPIDLSPCSKLKTLKASRLPRLPRLPLAKNLGTLELAGYPRLSTEHISKIHSVAPDIESLNLSGCAIFEEAIDPLLKFKKLKDLKLNQTPIRDTTKLSHLKLQAKAPDFFGLAHWIALIGDPGQVPPLPKDIDQIMNSPCPYDPDKKLKVRDTHMLTLIPSHIDGEPLTLQRIGALTKKAKSKNQTGYRSFLDGGHARAQVKKPYWVLMTKDVIKGTRGKSYDQQKELLEEGYEVPNLVEAATSILCHYVWTGERLFTDKPWTYTRCVEKYKSENWQMVVGDFAAGGLAVYDSCLDRDYCGLAGLRKFHP